MHWSGDFSYGLWSIKYTGQKKMTITFGSVFAIHISMKHGKMQLRTINTINL